MSILIVTNASKDWPRTMANAEVVDASLYVTDPKYSEMQGAKVFNLCRSFRYQSTGYYVSLLAEARGHKPLPSISTVQVLKTQAIIRMVSDDLNDLIQKSLTPIKSETFALSIYFGRNMAKRYDRLALKLFNQFPTPLLRAHFAKADDSWQLRRIHAISGSEVPNSHWPFVVESATLHFSRRRDTIKKQKRPRFDIAILHNPQDPEPPSDEKALQRFAKAAASLGIGAEMITRDDYGRLAEFDALFIRDTTSVDHYTYRFSQRAASEGLVVIDDPQSIVRCTNKVYLAELLTGHNVPIPRTLVLHRDNAAGLGEKLGFPCVLKKPDSSFSQGVVKVSDDKELQVRLSEFFAKSDLIVAQEYLPTTFDWRIGIIDRRPLYACKYFMARGHWQIIRADRVGRGRYGKSETVSIEEAPRHAVQVALKAANLIGDGLYGVDVKESEGKFYVIEVNDNPNLDYKCEDIVLKNELYRRIMRVFRDRIESRKGMN